MKDYPLRKEEELILDVCECGHASIDHETDWGSAFDPKTVDHEKDYRPPKTIHCKICVCEEYKFELKMECSEHFRLVELEKERKKDTGYSV